MGAIEKMKTKIELNIWKVKNDKMRNFRERIWFIKYWADYIKTHPDKEWSKGQAVLIDSQMMSSRHFYKSLEKTEEGRKILSRLMKRVIAK